MFWYLLRCIFYPYKNLFFKKSKGVNIERIKVDKPVLLAVNHPNAFMDPIAVSCQVFSPRTFYMARGDAFKPGIISKILTATGIIPIFRMRDAGIEGVKKNNQSFSIAYNMWNKNRKIMVFAEGLCIQERRLRSIQKGTARMAFGFMEEFKRDDFIIIPIGIHYSHPSKFRSDFYCEVGEPIAVKDFYTLYKENQAKAVNQLTKLIEERMLPLIPNLKHKENDLLIEQLQEIYKDEYLRDNKLDHKNLQHHQLFWHHIAQKLNELTENKPELTEELRSRSSAYSNKLVELNITDTNVYNCKNNKLLSGSSLLKLICFFPPYLIGKLLHFFPWYIAKTIAKKTAKNIEFYMSVNFVVSTFMLFFGAILQMLAVWLIFKTWWYLPLFFALKLIFGFIALWYSDNKKTWLGELKTSSLRKNNSKVVDQLITERSRILQILTS